MIGMIFSTLDVLYVSTSTPKFARMVGRYRRKICSLLDSYDVLYNFVPKNPKFQNDLGDYLQKSHLRIIIQYI